MNYIKSIWMGIYTVLVGMKITFVHLFAKNVTVQYPNERLPIPDTARNRLQLDAENCNGCNSCVRACPVNCISIETIKAAAGDTVPPLRSGGKRALWVAKYDLDMAKCCFCGLCTEACPTTAIRMTKDFEYSSVDKTDLLFHFSTMTPEQIKEKKELLAKAVALAAAEKKKAEEAK
jgi:NADH-quinone oxidoreductase subunit I